MAAIALQQSFRAGEIARLCGVSTDTLRHYERVGILPKPPRTAAGYRRYPEEAVARVRLIRRALGLGFTLAELTRVLKTRDRGGAPCREVRTLASRKLDQIDRQIADLAALRDYLRELLADWDRRLDAAPAGARAGLLDAMADPPCRKGSLR